MEIYPCLSCRQRLFYPQYGAPRHDMHLQLTLVICRTAVRHCNTLATEGTIVMGWIIISAGKTHSTDMQKKGRKKDTQKKKRRGICILFIEPCAPPRVTANVFLLIFPFEFDHDPCRPKHVSCFRCLNQLILRVPTGHASLSTLSSFSHFCSL